MHHVSTQGKSVAQGLIGWAPTQTERKKKKDLFSIKNSMQDSQTVTNLISQSISPKTPSQNLHDGRGMKTVP